MNTSRLLGAEVISAEFVIVAVGGYSIDADPLVACLQAVAVDSISALPAGAAAAVISALLFGAIGGTATTIDTHVSIVTAAILDASRAVLADATGADAVPTVSATATKTNIVASGVRRATIPTG